VIKYKILYQQFLFMGCVFDWNITVRCYQPGTFITILCNECEKEAMQEMES